MLLRPAAVPLRPSLMKTPAIVLLTAMIVAGAGCRTMKSVGSAVWPFGGKDKEERVAASTQAEEPPVSRPSQPARMAAQSSTAPSSATYPVSAVDTPSAAVDAPQRPATPQASVSSARKLTKADYLAVMTPGEVAVLQERARASGKDEYDLTDFLTEKERTTLQERASSKRTSASR